MVNGEREEGADLNRNSAGCVREAGESVSSVACGGGQERALRRWMDGAGLDDAALERLGIDGKTLARGLHVLRTACRDAWRTELLRGFNGNMSLRVGGGEKPLFLVTGTGSAKGHLTPCDVALSLDGEHLAGCPISTETPMHAAVYRVRPDVTHILHVHPAGLLALSLRVSRKRMLALPLFEARAWREKLAFVDELPPGTKRLAKAVARALADSAKKAAFMEGHGLVAVGTSPAEVLGLCEQYEHLAKVQLALPRAGASR